MMLRCEKDVLRFEGGMLNSAVVLWWCLTQFFPTLNTCGCPVCVFDALLSLALRRGNETNAMHNDENEWGRRGASGPVFLPVIVSTCASLFYRGV